MTNDTYEKISAATRLEGAHGWIQWKGTNVCIDLHCKCGEHFHLDREFAYFTQCPKCSQYYALGSYVRLVPLALEEIGKDSELCIQYPDAEDE